MYFNFLHCKKLITKVITRINTHIHIQEKMGIQYLNRYLLDNCSKTSIQKIISDIEGNTEHLKTLLDAKLHIEDNNSYTRFLQLISSSGTHNITLARLFHNSSHVLPNDVERWIDQDIIEPFEASSKSSIFGMLNDDISKISKQFVDLKIIPDHNVWQIIEIPIPNTNENAKMRLRREKENFIEFIIDLTHDAFGRMLMHGTVALAQNKGEFHNLNIIFKHSSGIKRVGIR